MNYSESYFFLYSELQTVYISFADDFSKQFICSILSDSGLSNIETKWLWNWFEPFFHFQWMCTFYLGFLRLSKLIDSALLTVNIFPLTSCKYFIWWLIFFFFWYTVSMLIIAHGGLVQERAWLDLISRALFLYFCMRYLNMHCFTEG